MKKTTNSLNEKILYEVYKGNLSPNRESIEKWLIKEGIPKEEIDSTWNNLLANNLEEGTSI